MRERGYPTTAQFKDHIRRDWRSAHGIREAVYDSVELDYSRVKGLTAGSVVYAGATGYLTQDNDNFFWDATNKRLGLNLNGSAPNVTLELDGNIRLVGTSYSTIGNYVGAGREILILRGKRVVTDGAGINLYGDGDSTYAGQIKFITNNTTVLTINAAQTLVLADGSSINLEEDITFTGATGVNLINFPDHLANALSFMEGANSYLTFVSTNGSELIQMHKLLSMDTAIPTAIDIGNSFTGSQITATGSSATDHAIEIDGVYGAALIYTHTSSGTADTLLWGDMASTATAGDFNGLRPRLTCNAASGGLNARAVYGEVIVGASKYAALAQGVLAHVSYVAGSCNITDIHALGVHISQGASLTATNLYAIIATVQTRGDETISGDDWMIRLNNEAVGGNGRQMDGAIQIVNTNMGGGVYGFTYGLDLSGADIATADIILQNSETIKNTTDGIIDFSAGNLLTTGTLGSGIFTITANSDTMVFTPDGTDANIQWSDGNLNLITDEGTNTVTYVDVKGKGTERAWIRVYDQDDAEQLTLTCNNGSGYLDMKGTSPVSFNFTYDTNVPIYFHPGLSSGNPVIQMHGWDSGASAKKYFRFQVAADGDALILAEDNLDINAGGGSIFLGNENIGINQSSFGTNSVGVVAQGTGTAPTTSPADCYQMYSADQVAGNACPHIRTENNAIIKLYQQALIADPAGQANDLDSEARTAINSILDILENNGLMANA